MKFTKPELIRFGIDQVRRFKLILDLVGGQYLIGSRATAERWRDFTRVNILLEYLYIVPGVDSLSGEGILPNRWATEFFLDQDGF